MTCLLLRPFLRLQMLGLGTGFSLATYQLSHQRPMKLDSPLISSAASSRRALKTLILQNSRLNPRTVRQISSGSILGTVIAIASLKWSRLILFDRSLRWHCSERLLTTSCSTDWFVSCLCTGNQEPHIISFCMSCPLTACSGRQVTELMSFHMTSYVIMLSIWIWGPLSKKI